MKNALGDALDLLCGRYETLEQCEMRVPDIVEEYKMVRNVTRNKSYKYTAIVPFLRVIERIDKETNIAS